MNLLTHPINICNPFARLVPFDQQKRIPREEVEAIHQVVERHAQELVKGVRVSLMGSYARGAQESGDVDILVAPPEGVEYLRDDFLHLLVQRLGPPASSDPSSSGGGGSSSSGGIGFLIDHFNAHKLATRKPQNAVRNYMGKSIAHSPLHILS